MSTYPLTDEQIGFYRSNGYVRLPDILTRKEMEDTRSALDDANRLELDARHHTSKANPDYERVFVQKVNLWTVHEGMQTVVHNPKIAEVARKLAGCNQIRLWHDHALVKMPGDSKESPWHQDLPYWPMDRPGALSCWIALDDVDEKNGCMQFIPESHLWGMYEPINLVNAQSLFGLAREAGHENLTPDVMRMKAGSCTFHNGLTFHYAGPNTTDKPRRALIVIYMPDGTIFTGKPHVVTDGLKLEPGEPFKGEMFPILSCDEEV